jgi:hypothetical protein
MFTSPLSTMYIAVPASPCEKIISPAWNVRRATALARAARSSGERPSNSGIDRRSGDASTAAGT